jgi:SAM-dependent methyltransferase
VLRNTHVDQPDLEDMNENENENEYTEVNRVHWDELAELHPTTAAYDVDGFLNGETSLNPLEREELGNVSGQSLLHLQCHFGLDTLSWAKEGAKVTGIDFSGKAIEAARTLRDEADLDARFIQSDIYNLPDVLNEQFDIVFTSYGVIYWLPDLDEWANVIEQSLRPGGTFYIVEIHPFTSSLEDLDASGSCRIAWPYFGAGPLEIEEDGSYADWDATLDHPTRYEWEHTFSDVVNAILDSGLDIEFIHEHPSSTFQQFEAMEQEEDGYWRVPDLEHEIPLRFSIRARKPV